ncbi:glycoside hydrolase family 2 protein [Desertivirga xinjiangensis]|uniref:glycoside hydrolase family 2 protein n=1 Tax=Desertivirga xinjiangensis TaxID=539206 RepID=UPI00210B9570|nr:sugar-binding domain-containing protein [Pedobacter xinjiangensis]
MRYLFLIYFLIRFVSAHSQDVPRPEYPRPQFERSSWINLNGVWSCTFDPGNSGKERGLLNSRGLDSKITVPFCPESKLSGLRHTDFIKYMWYQRQISVPESWAGKQILLNFGGVDYSCEIYIDSLFAGSHTGGTAAFSVDITRFVKPGSSNNLVVYVKDDVLSMTQPLGKQSFRYASSGARYTRTTGIWQTVWMEAVSSFGLKTCKITPDLDQKQFIIQPEFYNLAKGNLIVRLKAGNKVVSEKKVKASHSSFVILPVKSPRTWSPEDPFLYTLELEVRGETGQLLDRVISYAGMRKVHIEGNWVYLNNKPYYLRFVLDQGFYPDGIWTAPTDEALKRDIELSMKAGFNGARLHEKVFEERFHYWADKLGYLVWAEASDWGPDRTKTETRRNLTDEWTETLNQRINHPAIIGWTPLNELWNTDNTDYIHFNQSIYKLTRLLDTSRPVITAAGGDIYLSDIWTVHDYAQNDSLLYENLKLKDKVPDFSPYHVVKQAHYNGQPFMVSEYGGIKWATDPAYKNSWGYGNAPKNIEEVFKRMEGLTNTILKFDHISGYCFTQLTNVEQEQNGIYNYDRTPKFDMERVRAIFSKDPVWLRSKAGK